VHLAKYAEKVTLLARGDSLSASMSDYLIREIEDSKNIDLRLHTQVTGALGETQLEGLVLHDSATDTTHTVAAAALFVTIGAQPHTDWLPTGILRDPHGFILTGSDLRQNGALPSGWPLDRSPLQFETSVPGVFAAGDVRHQSVKRVASAVGEGGIAIQMIHRYLSTLAATP
jgi:thioredoxin reductase (NADPH)